MPNDEQCAAGVHRDYHNYRCSRSAGHGPNGAYCKQHAAAIATDDTPTITVWETGRYRDDIEPVRATRVTDKSVWVVRRRGRVRRVARASEHGRYHDTWQDAHNHLVERTKAKLDKAKADVTIAADLLDQLAKLTEPEATHAE